MPPPKAPLTHFLCLPLATSTSTPHLSSSLQKFASSYSYPLPPTSAPSHESTSTPSRDPGSPSPPPTLPPAPFGQKAVRPVGTLHLTLGVMNLQAPERVEAALS